MRRPEPVEGAGLGIYHYGARFYSPKLGRFLSPDTIVPGYANPQNLNRFSYVTNNPLRYTDPTGHMMTVDDGGGCSPCTQLPQKPKDKPKKDEEEANLCNGRMSGASCGEIFTEPGTVRPSSVSSPAVGGDTSDGNINFNYQQPGGLDYLSGIVEGLTWLHYNSGIYGQTGGTAQAAILYIHHNNSGTTVVPGLYVYNNTGMNLIVNGVAVNNLQIPLASSPSIPDQNVGAIQFSDALVMPDANISVQINFVVSSNSGVFGTGSMNYNGPNHLPIYGPLPP